LASARIERQARLAPLVCGVPLSQRPPCQRRHLIDSATATVRAVCLCGLRLCSCSAFCCATNPSAATVVPSLNPRVIPSPHENTDGRPPTLFESRQRFWVSSSSSSLLFCSYFFDHVNSTRRSPIIQRDTSESP